MNSTSPSPGHLDDYYLLQGSLVPPVRSRTLSALSSSSSDSKRSSSDRFNLDVGLLSGSITSSSSSSSSRSCFQMGCCCRWWWSRRSLCLSWSRLFLARFLRARQTVQGWDWWPTPTPSTPWSTSASRGNGPGITWDRGQQVSQILFQSGRRRVKAIWTQHGPSLVQDDQHRRGHQKCGDRDWYWFILSYTDSSFTALIVSLVRC